MLMLLPVVAATPKELLTEWTFSIEALLVAAPPTAMPAAVLFLITELRMKSLPPVVDLSIGDALLREVGDYGILDDDRGGLQNVDAFQAGSRADGSR